MRARRFVRAFAPAVVVTFLSVPSAVLAQDAEIAGVVTDNTGGILPGVTVEASSPALIEQSRVVFTDSQGAYRIIALNPRRVHGDVHPARLHHGGPGGDHADRHVLGQRRRADVGRRRRGDHHGHRREPADRRPDRHPDRGAHHGGPRRAADGTVVPESGNPGPRRAGAAEPAGRGWRRRRELADDGGPWQPRRPDAAGPERHAVQQHEQHRRRLQPHAGDQHRHRGGDDRHDERHRRRVPLERRRRQQHLQGGRQPVHLRHVRRLHQRRHAVQQPVAGPDRPGAAVGQLREAGLGVQPVVRRTHRR